MNSTSTSTLPDGQHFLGRAAAYLSRGRIGSRGTAVRWLPLLLAVTAAASVLLSISPWPVGVFQDDGIYAILGKALANGDGYRYTNIPGAPHATHYPPLYPAFLALMWKLSPNFPENVTLFKFANAAFIGGACALFYLLGHRVVGLAKHVAAVAALGFTACRPVLYLAVMVLSEPLFLLLLATSLILSERAAASGKITDTTTAVLAIIMLAMARTLGAVVLPALILVLAYRRFWRAALVATVIGVLGLLPWQLWVAAHQSEVPDVFIGKYGSYSQWLIEALRGEGLPFVRDVAAKNLRALFTMVSTASGTAFSWPGWARLLAGAIGLTVFGTGYVQLIKRAPVVFLFIGAYIAVVIVWPFPPDRFVWAIWPVLGLVLGLGFSVLWRNTSDAIRANGSWSLRTASVHTTLLLLAVGHVLYNSRMFLSAERDLNVQKVVGERLRPIAEWVITNTETSDVLATDSDALMYLYTGRRAIPSGVFTAQEYIRGQTVPFAIGQLRNIMSLYKPDYVLASTDYAVYAVRGSLTDSETPALRMVMVFPIGAAFAATHDPKANAQ